MSRAVLGGARAGLGRRTGLAAARAGLALCAALTLGAEPAARAQPAETEGPEVPTPAQDTTLVFSIRSTLPLYRFRVEHDPESGTVTRIEVTRGDDPKPLQALTALTADEPPPGGVDDVGVEDVNFDGYADLKVLAMWGATGNRTYDWFLFDPDSSRFLPEPALSDLVNPVPDPVTETIHTRSGGGMAGLVYQEGTYRWEGGSPVCVRVVRQDWDPAREVFARVTEEPNDSALVPVSRGIYFDGEVSRGGSFAFAINDSLRFQLDPYPGGWEIAVRAVDRPEENLARLTLPLHGPNPRQIMGWHFQPDGAGGVRPAGPGAPQRERGFIFSQKVGRSIQGPQSDLPPTPEEIEEVERDGTGTLTIEDLKLADPAPGEPREIEWMRFAVTVDFR